MDRPGVRVWTFRSFRITDKLGGEKQINMDGISELERGDSTTKGTARNN